MWIPNIDLKLCVPLRSECVVYRGDDFVGSYGLYLWPVCTEGFLMAAGYKHECTRLQILLPFFTLWDSCWSKWISAAFYFFFSSAGRTLSSGNIYTLIHESPLLHFFCHEARRKRFIEMTETFTYSCLTKQHFYKIMYF